jgi:N,N'-diacetyllegionaminate synthase
MKTKTIIIAEAGVNHNGKVNLAKKLVKIAKNAGADYVKFQYFNPEYLTTNFSKQADYQKKTYKQKKNSQKTMLKKLCLSLNQLIEVHNYCKKKKIKFAISVFDHISLKNIKKFNLDFIKIPSGEITNYPLLRDVAKMNKKIILSTGMSNIKDIYNALRILRKYKQKKSKITLMHCTTNYPASEDEVNISSITEIKKKFKIDVGYSDHTSGNEAACAAVSFGARIFEKHFTISRKLDGPDHSASLEPTELKNYIKSIKKTVKMIGTGKKTLLKSEKKNFKIVRKSIYANKKINIGEYFTEQNIITKRPLKNSNPMNWTKIIGSKSKRNYKIDDEIEI